MIFYFCSSSWAIIDWFGSSYMSIIRCSCEQENSGINDHLHDHSSLKTSFMRKFFVWVSNCRFNWSISFKKQYWKLDPFMSPAVGVDGRADESEKNTFKTWSDDISSNILPVFWIEASETDVTLSIWKAGNVWSSSWSAHFRSRIFELIQRNSNFDIPFFNPFSNNICSATIILIPGNDELSPSKFSKKVDL